MSVPPAVLLTTCHVHNDGTGDLLKLVASVGAALRNGEVGSLRHIILLQGCTSAERDEIKPQLPPWVELLSTDAKLSSSRARNVMIRHLVENDRFDPDAFIAFPDDDAWYPSGALACVARHFRGPANLQLLLGRYGPSPSADRCGAAFRATLQQALSRGACAAIFVRASLVAQLGGFHELLGLGTELSGGEDTEFVHRAFHLRARVPRRACPDRSRKKGDLLRRRPGRDHGPQPHLRRSAHGSRPQASGRCLAGDQTAHVCFAIFAIGAAGTGQRTGG